MPTLILSVLSLEKDGFLAAGTLSPPLPEGALPGLPVAAVGLVYCWPPAPLAVFPELLILIIMLLLIVVFPCLPFCPVYGAPLYGLRL